MNVELLLNEKNQLGEGPCWDSKNQCLYWVDILKHRLYKYEEKTKKLQFYNVGDYVSAVGLCESGRLILSPNNGLSLFDPETGQHDWIQNPEGERPANRYNDGKVDPAGRFWIGSMELSAKAFQGALYCLSPDHSVEKKLTDVTISNGLAWSPDRQTFYFIDTPTQEVVAFDYDAQSGGIHNKRVVFTISPSEGSPDGMSIDVEGRLWVCHWGGGKVTRWDPDTGKQLDEILLPVSNVTCCTFGGHDLSDLFITTAREGLTNEELEREPLAGGVFKVRTTTKGLDSFKFKDI